VVGAGPTGPIATRRLNSHDPLVVRHESATARRTIKVHIC